MEKEKIEHQEIEEEIQGGEGKSIARQEALKHLVKQHPKKDTPLVDGEAKEEQ